MEEEKAWDKVEVICHMELREGDTAKNQNIRSSRGSAE